jgi:hypothetical protein
VPDAIAIYAAAVGSGSLGWQVYREINRSRTKIRVEVEHATRPRQGPFVVWGGDPVDPRPDPIEYELTLVVVNDGETTEFVRDLWIHNPSRGEGFDVGLDGDGDAELAPRSRLFQRFALEGLPVDLSEGFYGQARLASGRVLQSSPERLDDGLLEHVRGFNETARA